MEEALEIFDRVITRAEEEWLPLAHTNPETV
jgi:hypothetical protein